MSLNYAAGIGATVALSLARMYRDGFNNYSLWCGVGGLAVAALPYIMQKLPVSVASLLADRKVGSYVLSESVILTGLIGAFAYEMAFDGRVSLADVSVSGAVRAATGAVSAIAGSQLGSYVGGMIGF